MPLTLTSFNPSWYIDELLEASISGSAGLVPVREELASMLEVVEKPNDPVAIASASVGFT